MRQRFNPHKRVNDYQRYSMLTIQPLSLCLAPSAIHLRSELQATIIFAGITIPLSAKKHILKVFVYLMMRNVMVKTCLNEKIINNSNLIQAMKNSVCPKAKATRRPNFSESHICPNIYRMFRSVDRTHDMVIVKWHEVTLIHFSESRICPSIYRMFRSVDWTHDMIIVKWPLLIWHNRKLCALTNAQRFNPHKRINDYQRYSMLTILPLRSMSCTLGNSSSLWAAGDDHFFRYYNQVSAKIDILKFFLCIWWWQMLRWKHALTRKL